MQYRVQESLFIANEHAMVSALTMQFEYQMKSRIKPGTAPCYQRLI